MMSAFAEEDFNSQHGTSGAKGSTLPFCFDGET